MRCSSPCNPSSRPIPGRGLCPAKRALSAPGQWCVVPCCQEELRVSSARICAHPKLFFFLLLSSFSAVAGVDPLPPACLQTRRRCKLARVHSACSIGAMCATLFGVCEDGNYLPLAPPNQPIPVSKSCPCFFCWLTPTFCCSLLAFRLRLPFPSKG